jgi:hypothetical protein
LHLHKIANQHTTQFNTLIKKFLFPLNKALIELNVQCKKWAVTATRRCDHMRCGATTSRMVGGGGE